MDSTAAIGPQERGPDTTTRARRGRTIGATLAGAVGVGGLVVCLLALALMQMFSRVSRATTNLVDVVMPGVRALESISASTIRYRTAGMERLLAGSADDKESAEAQMEHALATIEMNQGSYESAPMTAEERADYQEFMARWATYLQAHLHAMDLAETNATDAHSTMTKTAAPLFDASQEKLVLLVTRAGESADLASRESQTLYRRAQIGGYGGLAGLVVLGGVWARWTIRRINRSLGGVAAEIGASGSNLLVTARVVADSAHSLSRGATGQAASLEETSATMEEIASMTRRNAEHSSEAAGLMAEVDAEIRQSNAGLDKMVASMDAIRDSSRRVSKIIRTIDEIAFQTNILALNAAVEAARAGEAGMGFAVVADEVRALAHRSAEAAKDTAELIEQSIARTDAGHANVAGLAQSITSTTARVGQVKALVDGVSVASREQSHGIHQVSQALAQVERVTLETAATADESVAASEALHEQAEIARRAASHLVALVKAAPGAELEYSTT